MTKPTPHGQVSEALIDLIDTYAETRHRYGRIYNAKTEEAARNAVIEALSGVQALGAGPAGWKLVPEDATEEMVRATDKVNFANADTDGTMHNVWNVMLAATPTPPAEQAAPNPAPAPLSDDVVRDAAFEAVRKKLCTLPRYSFVLDDDGLVRRAPDRTGNWIEFDEAHALFDPVSVDAALAAQGGKA